MFLVLLGKKLSMEGWDHVESVSGIWGTSNCPRKFAVLFIPTSNECRSLSILDLSQTPCFSRISLLVLGVREQGSGWLFLEEMKQMKVWFLPIGSAATLGAFSPKLKNLPVCIYHKQFCFSAFFLPGGKRKDLPFFEARHGRFKHTYGPPELLKFHKKCLWFILGVIS